MEIRVCELCDNEAAFYCTSDSAFLCSTCDTKVHHVNFLVARHLRRALCSKCNSLSQFHFSGPELTILRPLCQSCSGILHPNSSEHHSSLSSSSDSSTACVSSSESISTAPIKNRLHDRSSAAATEVRVRENFNVDSKARNVFENWCRKLGLENWKAIVAIAAQAFSVCMTRLTVVPPLKVALAAAFWLGLRYSKNRSMLTIQNLTRLAEISGVAAKVIVFTERKFSFALRERRRRRQSEIKEGWAESQ